MGFEQLLRVVEEAAAIVCCLWRHDKHRDADANHASVESHQSYVLDDCNCVGANHWPQVVVRISIVVHFARAADENGHDQAICCLVMPIFIGSSCKVDDDGNPDYDLRPMVGAYAVAVVKYIALMALHGSVIGICVAVFVMTPETAHDGGRFLNDSKQLFKAH